MQESPSESRVRDKTRAKEDAANGRQREKAREESVKGKKEESKRGGQRKAVPALSGIPRYYSMKIYKSVLKYSALSHQRIHTFKKERERKKSYIKVLCTNTEKHEHVHTKKACCNSTLLFKHTFIYCKESYTVNETRT